jgi:hypothetical protein
MIHRTSHLSFVSTEEKVGLAEIAKRAPVASGCIMLGSASVALRSRTLFLQSTSILAAGTDRELL